MSLLSDRNSVLPFEISFVSSRSQGQSLSRHHTLLTEYVSLLSRMLLKYCGWLEPPAGYRDDVFAKEVKEVFSELEVAGLDSNPKKWDVSSTWNVEPFKRLTLALLAKLS